MFRIIQGLIQAFNSMKSIYYQMVNARLFKVWRHFLIAVIWLALSGQNTFDMIVTAATNAAAMDIAGFPRSDIGELSVLAWFIIFVQSLPDLIVKVLKFTHKVVHTVHDYHSALKDWHEVVRLAVISKRRTIRPWLWKCSKGIRVRVRYLRLRLNRWKRA